MNRVVRVAGVTLGLVGLVLICLSFLGYRYFKQDQPQMFADPHFDTEPVELVMPPDQSTRSVLVFSKTNGFRHHESIPAAEHFVREISEPWGWYVLSTENASYINTEQLAHFDLVIWNNASGPLLTDSQQTALREYIEDGGGFVALHAAGDASHEEWAWYHQRVIRAPFWAHILFPQFQTADVHSETLEHPIMVGMPKVWTIHDELYSFKHSPRAKGVDVLSTLDERSYDPNFWAMGEDHPIIWSHRLTGGRVLYSALGHLPSVYENPDYQRLLSRGLRWAAGESL